MLDRKEVAGVVGEWLVGIGVVDGLVGEEEGRGEMFGFTAHDFVGSTGDGGMAGMMKGVCGREVFMRKAYPVDGVEDGDHGKEVDSGEEEEKEGEEAGHVLAACHCNVITFTIKRTAKQGKCQGKHCACNSCRLATSTPISSWFRVPAAPITPTTLFPSPNPSLRTYTYSPVLLQHMRRQRGRRLRA